MGRYYQDLARRHCHLPIFMSALAQLPAVTCGFASNEKIGETSELIWATHRVPQRTEFRASRTECTSFDRTPSHPAHSHLHCQWDDSEADAEAHQTGVRGGSS